MALQAREGWMTGWPMDGCKSRAREFDGDNEWSIEKLTPSLSATVLELVLTHTICVNETCYQSRQ